jgi:vacuolar protein sorting-associated protein 54
MMASVMQSVPDIFFSPYFDLTDPVCFENLLVISDVEVAQIRKKEAELHALADRKVREAERVAALDAQNANAVPRVPLHKGDGAKYEVAASTFPLASEVPTAESLGATSPAKTSSPPSSPDVAATAALTRDSGNVITLRKPETFTSHLDAVELVLLDQVRSKSERFFRETNRFSELQQLVTSSVDEVRELRNELQSIRERCVTNVEIVPVMDDSRKDLRTISEVLEAVEDVANCKASIASLMGVGDHLGAVEAIRLARSLLAGSHPEGEFEDDDDRSSEEKNNNQMGDGFETTPPSSSSFSRHHQSKRRHHFSLGKLKALSKVGEQLNEYEKLVVQSLTNKLVDTFLSWGSMDAANVDYRVTPRISLTLDERANIRGVVQSLRVCGQLSSAGAEYKRKLCELISVTVRAIVTECVADAAKNSGSRSVADGTGSSNSTPPAKGTMSGVAFMSMDQFFDCINMLFEQVLGLLWGAFAVNKFCIDEGFILDDNVQNSSLATSDGNERRALPADTVAASGERSSQQHTPSATAVALAAAADLCEKSVSELLRLRREAHSLVSFDGMRQLWDTSLTFTHQLEKCSGKKAYGLRSTLLAQAKSFVERKHEANMSALVAALDSERWVQCNVRISFRFFYLPQKTTH